MGEGGAKRNEMKKREQRERNKILSDFKVFWRPVRIQKSGFGSARLIFFVPCDMFHLRPTHKIPMVIGKKGEG